QRGALSSSLGVPVSPFYPVVGNEVLPRSPLEAIRDGLGADVDVLIGTNKDEATLFVAGEVDEKRLARDAERFGGGEALLDAYRRSLPEADPMALSVAMSTDHMFRIPALRLAEARAEHNANTWMYLFAWESRNTRLKSTHALEIPFAFNNLDKAGVDVFLGEGPVPQHVADEMHRAWIGFIRDGDPGWPQYTLDERPNMRFDDTSGVVPDPDAGRREAWDGLR
ncbi:MAG: carboxylesterase family protein, partial [Pseudomonadales bacterium]|nr:carboxylesterase family protein [Pseudomonadales bacterium]